MLPEQAFAAEKDKVAQSFGAAAAHYEKVAVLQRLVAERLLERLELIRLAPERIVDMGSGTGWLAAGLHKHYPRARIIELDLALDMLRFSRSKRRDEEADEEVNTRAFVCADAEALPLAESAVDMLSSSLMLQWCNDVDAVFAAAAGILRANGLFLFSSFGPDTLMELRKSWAAADADGVHVNHFVDMHDLGDALLRAGFEQPVMERETFSLAYNDVYALMRELKRWGAHNVSRGRRRSITGKRRLERLCAAYEALRTDEGLPATFEVVYGHAWMPEVQTARALDAQTAVFPVSALRRTRAV